MTSNSHDEVPDALLGTPVDVDIAGFNMPPNSSDRICISLKEPDNEVQVERLIEQGFSRGLAKSMENSILLFPLRYWIVDNSGSMSASDGNMLAHTACPANESCRRFVSCTRWEEIQDCATYHIELAGLLQAPTRFRLLNDPGEHIGPQQFSVAEDPKLMIKDVQEASKVVLSARPSGGTPLTSHMKEIYQEVSGMAPILLTRGQKVCITIATDGMPTNEHGFSGEQAREEFVESLRSFEALPVWIVVRLCTDNENVVHFYNELDSLLELSIEVLDDFWGEAQEVFNYNPWLNYAQPLHRMREMGFHDSIFDMLDERPLTSSELRDFCTSLFGSDQMDGVPDPIHEWDDFVMFIQPIVAKEGLRWNPLSQQAMPWIDMARLDARYRSGFPASQSNTQMNRGDKSLNKKQTESDELLECVAECCCEEACVVM
jgi:hypothetical protein